MLYLFIKYLLCFLFRVNISIGTKYNWDKEDRKDI